jgi:hypothetical protein
MPKFSKKSLDILSKAHPDLQRLFKEVINEYDCTITCSYRGREDQEQAFKDGNSNAHWLESAHNYLPSFAVDCVPWPTLWSSEEKLKELMGIVKIKAIDMGIKITYGGDWTFKNGKHDYPHYEIKGWQKMI